jgi:hypothetical protein
MNLITSLKLTLHKLSTPILCLCNILFFYKYNLNYFYFQYRHTYFVPTATPLFSSPGPKGQVSFCHHFASVVVCVCNHWTDLDQAWQKCSYLVEDHPDIISIMLQFHRQSSFWQEDFQSFNQSEHIIAPSSHVGFPICTKITNLVEELIISLDNRHLTFLNSFLACVRCRRRPRL